MAENIFLKFWTNYFIKGKSVVEKLMYNSQHWDKEQQSKAQNLDSKYGQMALIGFDT